MTFAVHDRADEFRIELIGKFSGEIVEAVASSWKNALADTLVRRLMVDISRLSGYDHAGRRLLHQMYQHGTQFAAGNPVALAFLNEISIPERRGPASLQSISEGPANSGDRQALPLWRARAAGSK